MPAAEATVDNLGQKQNLLGAYRSPGGQRTGIENRQEPRSTGEQELVQTGAEENAPPPSPPLAVLLWLWGGRIYMKGGTVAIVVARR